MMRPRLVAVATSSLCSLAALTAVAHAQAPGAVETGAPIVDDAGPQDTLTINPLEALIGLANVAYERGIGRHASIQIEGLYGSFAATTDAVTTTADLASVTVQPHFYFGERTLEGAYIAPLAQISQLGVHDTMGSSASATGVGVGATGGYSWLLGPVNLKLGIGAKVMTASVAGVDGGRTAKLETAVGAGLTMDLSAGFAF